MTIQGPHSQRRLGDLTRLLRRRSGLSRKWVAERAGVERSVVRAIEKGKQVDPLAAARVMAVMERDLDERRVDSPKDQRLINGEDLSLAGKTQALPNGNDPEVVLKMYLDLVCAVRGLRGRTSMTLRSNDIDELSEVLHMPTDEVAAHLVRLMAGSLNKVVI